LTLASFITEHLEEILEEWEVIARARVTRDRVEQLSVIRDHLGELLRAIARDMDAAHTRGAETTTPDQRAARSGVEAIGEKHGAGRAEQGFPLNEVVAEFPALRSCVTRLWLGSLSSVTPADVDDLLRFDDALDAALTRSISEFSTWLDTSREKFLGILGHDLRNPLSAIIGAAHLIVDSPKTNANEEVRSLTTRIIHSGERMHRMLVDLLDFARMRLGGTMPIERRPTDLEKSLRDLAEEFATSHPRWPLRVEIDGDLRGQWDDQRISQAIANLLGNAANHGMPDTPITLGARGGAQDVSISVHNDGPPIPAERREQIFEPLVRGSERSPASGDRNSIGLGLYIAKAIVTGHGGRIEVDSSAKTGTTFTVHLPR